MDLHQRTLLETNEQLPKSKRGLQTLFNSSNKPVDVVAERPLIAAIKATANSISYQIYQYQQSYQLWHISASAPPSHAQWKPNHSICLNHL